MVQKIQGFPQGAIRRKVEKIERSYTKGQATTNLVPRAVLKK